MNISNFIPKTVLATVALVLLMSSHSTAQSPDAVFEQVSAALSKGDANALSTHFATSVEVTLPTGDQTYSSQQATFVLKDFFAKHPVKGFSILHKGNSGATWYATGTYSSSAGVFDANIFVKKTAEKFQITQIRFEAE
jgi:hypothetical protein